MAAACAVVLCGSSALALAAPDPKGDPEKWILDLSNEMLSTIKADEKLKSGDAAAVQAFVSDKVMPSVDFVRMTRMAVGPSWRSASAEQREELQKLFRELLIRVYSGALSMVSDQSVELAPSRVKPEGDDVVVRTLMKQPGKPDTHLDYRVKLVKGEWRIINVNAEGVWIV
ncbi:MAG TPA: toluene tolerance protein, partial [Sutterella sp.]|nr:toluene tolerance protein [Sutterella sp.]